MRVCTTSVCIDVQMAWMQMMCSDTVHIHGRVCDRSRATESIPGRREDGELWMAVPSGLYADRVKSVLTSNFRSVLGPGIVHEPLDSVQ